MRLEVLVDASKSYRILKKMRLILRVEVIAQIHNATRMKRPDKIRATKMRVEVIAHFS